MAEITTTLPPLRIGKVEIGFPVVQAALSGYSDWPMRALARRHGADYALCEVVLDQFVLAAGRRAQRKHLHIGGGDVMQRLGVRPGPVIGQVLGKLLERVLEDPTLNEREALLRLVDEIGPGEADAP